MSWSYCSFSLLDAVTDTDTDFLHGQAVNQCFLNSYSNSGPSKSSVRATYKKKRKKKRLKRNTTTQRNESSDQ